MPIIGDVRIDSVHDLLFLGYKTIRRLAYPQAIYVYLLIAVSAITLVILAVKSRHLLIESIGTISNRYDKQTYSLALLFLSLIFVALVLDLGIVYSRVLFVLEEFFEMNAALVLLFCSLSLYD